MARVRIGTNNAHFYRAIKKREAFPHRSAIHIVTRPTATRDSKKNIIILRDHMKDGRVKLAITKREGERIADQIRPTLQQAHQSGDPAQMVRAMRAAGKLLVETYSTRVYKGKLRRRTGELGQSFDYEIFMDSRLVSG